MTTKKVVIERKKQEQSLENGMESATVVNGVSKSCEGTIRSTEIHNELHLNVRPTKKGHKFD